MASPTGTFVFSKGSANWTALPPVLVSNTSSRIIQAVTGYIDKDSLLVCASLQCVCVWRGVRAGGS